MTERFQTDHRELDDLFDRYRAAPRSHVFAPLADACRKAGMLEEALEICARGVEDHPRYASGYVVQGKCLYDAGRGQDAEAAFDRVLQLDPKNLVALKYLGIIHAERGESGQAREYFEHILALDPDNREIRSRFDDVRTPVQASPEIRTTIPEIDGTPVEEKVPLLPEVEDEAFEGEPITLRDESVTSDEIATMTLADIYASQGYTSRALKIYREVQKRQPGNTALMARIETLEKEAKAAVIETPVPVAVAETPAVAERARSASAPREKSRPDREEVMSTPRPAPSTAPPDGHPIDQSQSYEQFKRWLKASSR